MILVVGATGHLGGLITRTLLSEGRTVRILARQDSTWQPLHAAGAQVAIGDLKSRPTLDAACTGVDVVVTTANSAQRAGADTTQTVDTDGNRHLIDAARESGVKQFVFVSAFGVTPDSPVPLFRAKALTEAYLRSSGLTFTILAPDVFMDVWIPMVVGPALRGLPVTIIGDGRTWDQLRFNAFPSKAAFMAVATDPDRLRMQSEHRETAIADTYSLLLRPAIDRLAASIA